jgi:hypothetical protein
MAINFSLPNLPSFTSRTPNELPILFVSNVPFILKIVDGDVGIAKKIQQKIMQKNLPNLRSARELKEFSKVSGANLGPNPEQFIKDGKVKPPPSVQIDKTASNLGGLDAFEKSLLQAIFETQKPYIEIAKIAIGLFVDLEDIVAHVLGVAAPSSKPKGNPRALGYQGEQKGFKKDGTGGVGAGMNSLGKIASKKPPQNKLSDNKFSPENIASQSTAEQSTSQNTGKYIGITISTVYSTEEFDPNVEYTYIYKDYFEEFNPNIDSDDTALEEEDDSGKDETIVLGVYNQDYDPVFYHEVKDRLPWLVDKYVGGGPWPQIKPSENFDYIYSANLLGTELTNVGGPGSPSDLTWEIKRYQDGEGPSIQVDGQTKSLKKGQLAVAYNSEKTQSLLRFFKDFYMEYTDKRLEKALGSTPSTYTDDDGSIKDVRVEARKDLESKISDFGPSGMIPMQVEGLVSNNFMKLSKNQTGGLTNIDKFDKIAYAFKPKKLGDVWYDPEAEYDMKIIKCDITSDITYLQNVGEREKQAKFVRFIKKSYSIQFANQKTISYFLDVADGLFFIENQKSITIDYYTGPVSSPEVGQSRIHILENSRTYQLKNSEFPIKVILVDIPTELTNYWNYDTKKRAYFKLESNYYILVFEEKLANSNEWTIDSFVPIISGPFNKVISTYSSLLGFNNPTLYELNFNGYKVLVSSSNIYYGIIKDINLLQYVPDTNQINNVIYDLDTNTATVTQEIKPNLIRIEDTDGGQRIPKIVTGLGNNANITNQQLNVKGPLGKEAYGTPIIGSEPGDTRNQTVEQIFRYPRTSDDIQTYYIIEAVLKSKNKNQIATPNEEAEIKGKGGNGKKNGSGGGYYICCTVDSFPFCLVGIIRKFIRIVIKIAIKLIPAIQKFINIIKNPPQALTDIIIAKLGDDFGTETPKFGFYSKDFINQLKEVKKYAEDLKNSQNNEELKQEVKDKLKTFLNTSLLKNYVFISDKGQGRFILDGASTLKLFGDAPMLKSLPSIVFGIETNLGSLISPEPQMPFKLIFSLNRVKSGTQKKLPDFLGVTSDNLSKDIKEASLYNANFAPVLTFKNKTATEAGGISSIEETSTVYSTGTFKESVLYEYFYLSEEVNSLVKEATELEELGDNSSLSKALDKLEEALKIDPNNGFVKGKIDALRKSQKNFSTQPILDFILNLVALPLKVVFGIITYIMNFFKSLANPFTLPVKIVEFVSFKWILDFFSPISPNSMFSMAGILFDIQKYFTEWLPMLAMPDLPKIPGVPNIPLGQQIFDLNQIIKLPWATFPTYTKEEFKAITFTKFPLPIMILNGILCFIESVINTFIDFMWSILGLVDPNTGKWIVIKPPYLNICKDTNKDLSAKDIAKLLNLSPVDAVNLNGGSTAGEGILFNPSITDKSPADTFNFTYYIKTSDGRDVRDLNQQEMDKFLEDNGDLQYTFNF